MSTTRCAGTRRRVALLGATGSIGRQTLEVAAALPERVEIVTMTARSDAPALAAAAGGRRPRYLGLSDPSADVSPLAGSGAELGRGPDALIAAATHPEV